MPRAALTPTHPAIKQYYSSLSAYRTQKVAHELALKSAFQNLLADTARLRKWLLIPEQSAAGLGLIRPDATIRDANGLVRGYLEAKDPSDHLDAKARRAS